MLGRSCRSFRTSLYFCRGYSVFLLPSSTLSDPVGVRITWTWLCGPRAHTAQGVPCSAYGQSGNQCPGSFLHHGIYQTGQPSVKASSESILVFLPGLEDEAQNRQCQQATASWVLRRSVFTPLPSVQQPLRLSQDSFSAADTCYAGRRRTEQALVSCSIVSITVTHHNKCVIQAESPQLSVETPTAQKKQAL